MTFHDIDQLNKKFALHNDDNKLNIVAGQGGIPCIKICNQHASVLISLQGAQILSWIPKGEEEVIWLSKDASFAPGKSIRGGIPICWPWFGPHNNVVKDANNKFPAHGFARTSYWQILDTETLVDGNTRISFALTHEAENADMWPVQTTVQSQITIGKKLEIELLTHNNGSEPISISQALHTYFKVRDVSKIMLHGLDDTDYLDKTDDFKRTVQHGPVTIEKEVDRIYLDTTNVCVLEDKLLNRNIIIIKCGSHSTVVWNPWQEVAEKMGDLGIDGYKEMLCVESGNVSEDVVTIQPGKAHQLWVQYEAQPLER